MVCPKRLIPAFSDHAYPAAMALARWKAGRAAQASM
jgi:hypothetical protein